MASGFKGQRSQQGGSGEFQRWLWSGLRRLAFSRGTSLALIRVVLWRDFWPPSLLLFLSVFGDSLKIL